MTPGTSRAGVEDDQGGRLPTGEDEVADGQDLVDAGADALVDALVAAAAQDQPGLGGQPLGDAVVETAAVEGEQDDPGWSLGLQLVEGVEPGPGSMTMPAPPPKGASSTLRWRSVAQSRRLWRWTSTRPRSPALPSRPVARGDSKNLGKMVTMSTSTA